MIELSFVIYQIIISFRIITEMNHLTFYIFIHQLFWFNSVLVCFFIAFRYLLKVEKNRLWILSAGAFLSFIPLAYATMLGEKWALNYIQPVSFSQVSKDLFTLLAFHPYNWPMFPELGALLAGSIAIGWYFSKNIKMSVFSSLTSVYSSFLLLGFSWFSVNPKHPTLFLLKSSFENSQFYALQLISYFSILCIIAFSKELLSFFQELPHKLATIPFFFIITFMIDAFFMCCYSANFTVPDMFVTFFPCGAFTLTIFLLFFNRKPRRLFLPVWITIFSIIATFTEIK